MGRPTEDPKTFMLRMRVSQAFLEMIDDWREDQKDKPSRAEAIRRLCESAARSRIRKR